MSKNEIKWTAPRTIEDMYDMKLSKSGKTRLRFTCDCSSVHLISKGKDYNQK